MRSFFRFFILDLIEGTIRGHGCLALMVVTSIVLSIAFSVRVSDASWSHSASFGDRCVAFTMGCSPYRKELGEPFEFPVEWACFMMTALYATLRYPLQSLSNGGEKLLIAGGNRWSWWLAKVAWTVAQALLYCVIAALIAAVFCLLSGGPLSFDTSPELMELYRYTGTRLSRQGMPGSLYCAFAVVCLVAMCLFQLMVSVAVHPVASFGVMLALLFASSFSSLTVFFGCYAMALRSDFFMANGIGGAAGCAFLAAIAVVSVVLGGVCFDRHDVVGERYE